MKKLTEGKPLKVIIIFMLPLLAGKALQLFYGIVDTRIVGQVLGEKPLAAVGTTTSLSDMLTQFIFGITNGFALISASYFGAKDTEKLKKTIAGTIILGAGFTLVISAVCLAFVDNILVFLKVGEELIPDARIYITIILAGLIASAMYNVCAATLRALGDSVTPLIFLIFSTLLNVVLDLVLVVLVRMGVAGAACATVISQAVSVILCFIYIKRKYAEYIPSREDFVLEGVILRKQIATGLSMGFMSSLFNFGTVCLQTQINSLGSYIIVSHTASRKIYSLMSIPFSVIGMAMASYCAQNMGAGRLDRIREGIKDALLACFSWAVVCIFIVRFFTEFLVCQITGMNIPEVIATSERYLGFSVWFYMVSSSIGVFRNSMQGFGDSVTPLVSSSLELIVKIIIAYFLVPIIGYDGVIICEPIAWVIMVIPLIINTLRSPAFKRQTAITSDDD